MLFPQLRWVDVHNWVPVWREQGGNMLGQPNKSSESMQIRVWQIFYIAGLILLAEYLTILYFLAFP